MADQFLARRVEDIENHLETTRGKEPPTMIADLEFTFSQHDETVRRAEANYALLSGSAPRKSDHPQQPPRRWLWEMLRRLAGPAAA
jgi:hypothetical protein